MSIPRLSCQLRLRYAARRSRMRGRSPRKSMSSLTWVTSCSRGSTKTSQRCFWHARTSVTISSSRIAPRVSSSACGWCRSSTAVSSDGPPNSGSAKPSRSALSRSRKPSGRKPALRMGPQPADDFAALVFGPDHDGRMGHRPRRGEVSAPGSTAGPGSPQRRCRQRTHVPGSTAHQAAGSHRGASPWPSANGGGCRAGRPAPTGPAGTGTGRHRGTTGSRSPQRPARRSGSRFRPAG